MSLSKVRLGIIALASAGFLLSTGCATSDGYYDGGNVHGSVGVGYYGGYYDDAWCCYGGYPPPIYYPPGGNRPGDGNRPVPPIATVPPGGRPPINGGPRPVQPIAPAQRPGGSGNYSRPMPSSRPASRPAPSPRPVSRPMGGGGRRR